MELPEVEIVCEEMRAAILGKEIISAWSHPSKRFFPAKKSAGHTIQSIGRHGKYIIAGMDQGDFQLIIHLGMSGSLKLAKTSSMILKEAEGELNQKYIRARWFYSDKTFMELRDVRRFGYVFWVKAGDYSQIPTLRDSGPDGLAPDFSPEALYTAIKKSSRNIKAQLLGQKPVAGLGNIYIDEALWAAGISPKSRRLGQERANLLHGAIVQCLKKGLKHGGTTLRDYRTFSGSSGDHQNHLLCYGTGRSTLLEMRYPACL